MLGFSTAIAQRMVSVEGSCGEDVRWKFDGNTLTVSNVSKKGLPTEMSDYNYERNLSPWRQKGYKPKKVVIGANITKIGSCAFTEMEDLQEVEFQGKGLQVIGWGAFMGCKNLRTLSVPVDLTNIETVAFANCYALPSVKIPDHCKVGDQAFLSCKGLTSIEVRPTALLGHYVFAREVNVDGEIRHALCNAEIRNLPTDITIGNCNQYGLSREAVGNYLNGKGNMSQVDYDYPTSEIDTLIPRVNATRTNTYALIIGNQNYRFTANVPYAIHDARIFKDYCQHTLNIPTENIHICEDGTKQMIMEEEFEWLNSIEDREQKKLIVYYAGHGVPDIKDKNKAYMLPVDVRGTKPQHGIALDKLYASVGELGFERASFFLDACFSGVNRDGKNDSGQRGVEIVAEDAEVTNDNVIVFSAAQGNETAQGYSDQGHGLFTYFLLKKIQESDGYVTYGQLAKYLEKEVSKMAPQLKLQKPQTPTHNVSDALSKDGVWEHFSF